MAANFVTREVDGPAVHLERPLAIAFHFGTTPALDVIVCWVRSCNGKARGFPGVETAGHVDHLAKPGSLQQAGSNRAAVSAFAMRGDWAVRIEFVQSAGQLIQGLEQGTFDVAFFPLALPAYVEHLHVVLPIAHKARQVLYGNLWHLIEYQVFTLPCFDTAIEVSGDALHSHPRQPQARFLDSFGIGRHQD